MTPRPKWAILALNEYRVNTARIRRLRRYLPFLVGIFLLIHIFVVAPAVVGFFMEDAVSLLISRTAVATLQITLLITFFGFLIMPLSTLLREVEMARFDILLAAPAGPGDLLLGEFIGELPFYAVLIVILSGFFTAILGPLGLGAAQILVAILIFTVTSISGLWIGTTVTAVARTLLARLAGGRDLGGAIAMILPLPLIAVAYSAWEGGLLEVLSDPNGIARTAMALFPSSWGARVVAEFARSPGVLHAPHIMASLGALAAFLGASLWLGSRVADHAYSLEGTCLSASTARPDGHLYRGLKVLGGGGSSGFLLVSVFKDYGRRLQNISNIAYILGMLALVGIFGAPSSGEAGSTVGVMAPLFLFPIMAIMVVGDVTTQGKGNLFVCRQAPKGLDGYLRAMVAKGWLVMVPLAVVTGALFTAGQPQGVVLTSLMAAIVGAQVVLVMGLFMLNPAFSEKSPKIWLNILIAIGLQVVIFVLSMVLLVVCTGGLSQTAPTADISFDNVIVWIAGYLALLDWAVAGGFFFLGKSHLSRVE